VTIDDTQELYDNLLPSEDLYCSSCEDRIIGEALLLNDKCYCEYCADLTINNEEEE